MRTKIVKMGKSTGICIPKIILEQCSMDKYVDLQIFEDKIVIYPVKDEAHKKLAINLDVADTLVDKSCWYEDETEWK